MESYLDGYGVFVMAKCLSWLESKIRLWTHQTFGAIQNCKLELLHAIEAMDPIRESRPLNPDNFIVSRSLGRTFLQPFYKKRSSRDGEPGLPEISLEMQIQNFFTMSLMGI